MNRVCSYGRLNQFKGTDDWFNKQSLSTIGAPVFILENGFSNGTVEAFQGPYYASSSGHYYLDYAHEGAFKLWYNISKTSKQAHLVYDAEFFTRESNQPILCELVEKLTKFLWMHLREIGMEPKYTELGFDGTFRRKIGTTPTMRRFKNIYTYG